MARLTVYISSCKLLNLSANSNSLSSSFSLSLESFSPQNLRTTARKAQDVQMAEKQKGASSPTNSKEKTSLLDLDIGKDFLTSWKSMSVTEDDSMDFDFSTVAKGKKKIFNFDNVDMDFTLDGDFGKISSFKVDMSDLDVSNSVKKAGKPEERSKEVSADGKLQGKSDRFTFPFDFNEFDSFNFEPSLMKKDKQSSKNQDAEKSSGQSGSRGSGIHLNEHIGALEDNIFLKHGASEGDTTSKFDGQLGRKFDSPNKDEPLKSLINEKCLSKSTTSEDVVGGARTSPEKSISCSTHEPGQESCPPEKITSPESYAQETCKDVSVQSVSGNLSTQDTATDLQEEVGSQARKDGAGTGGDQHIILKQDDSGFNYGNAQSDNLPPDMVCSQSSNGEKRKFEGDNHVQIGYKDGAEPAQGDSQFEQTSITTVSGELLHETVADGEILDSTSEFIASPLSSATTGDKAMSDKERETGVRSKYFNRSVETKSQLQPASLSHIKLTTSGSKRIGAAHQTSANESRKLQTKDAQSGNKLVGLPMSLPRELTRGEPVKIRKQGSIKDLTSNSGAFNIDNAGSTLTGTSSRLHDNDLTGQLMLSGTENNIKGFNTFNSHVLLSSLNEQANKSSSQNCQNPRLPVSGMKSIQNTKNNSAEKNKLSPLKPVGRTSDPSNLKNMRTTGSSCAPLKLTLQKDFISLTNSERSMALKGNTESRISQAADTKKQTSSSPTLKRKSLEEASAGLLTLKPMKRLSQSPGESRNLRESSQIIVDKQICNNENLADGTKENVFNNHQSPRLHTPQEVNMNELETPLTESDTNVKKAEACAKELEDICNMLKKKHEEAKEILVRAVVNNNNLLMLNHPIYEEKICMIQKFAASLMSK